MCICIEGDKGLNQEDGRMTRGMAIFNSKTIKDIGNGMFNVPYNILFLLLDHVYSLLLGNPSLSLVVDNTYISFINSESLI